MQTTHLSPDANAPPPSAAQPPAALGDEEVQDQQHDHQPQWQHHDADVQPPPGEHPSDDHQPPPPPHDNGVAPQQDQQDQQQQEGEQQEQQQQEQDMYQLYQQQQQCWYHLDARGKLEGYDEADFFVPAALPCKRRQHVSAGMAASKQHPWKRVRNLVAADNYQQLPADAPTFVGLAAPPPLYPPKRYCDITGCEAPYADPKTQLRYANAEAFRIARSLTGDEVQTRLAIRNAQSVLK